MRGIVSGRVDGAAWWRCPKVGSEEDKEMVWTGIIVADYRQLSVI